MWRAFEGDASYLLRKSGQELDGPVNVRALCVGLLGSPPRLARMRHAAELVQVNGRPRIYVRAGTPPARARWLACHELGHWWMRESGQVEPEHAEEQANVLGAILLAPGRCVTRLVRRVGCDPIVIAAELNTTQSHALLRLGETGHVPAAALLGSHWSLLRSNGPFQWPTDRYLRKLLRAQLAGGPQLAAIRITDEPDRAGLLVA